MAIVWTITVYEWKKTEKKGKKNTFFYLVANTGSIADISTFYKRRFISTKDYCFQPADNIICIFFYLDVIPFDISLDAEDLYVTESAIKSGLSNNQTILQLFTFLSLI